MCYNVYCILSLRGVRTLDNSKRIRDDSKEKYLLAFLLGFGNGLTHGGLVAQSIKDIVECAT